jgi:hypothetical protein
MVNSTLMFSFSCCYISLDRHNIPAVSSSMSDHSYLSPHGMSEKILLQDCSMLTGMFTPYIYLLQTCDQATQWERSMTRFPPFRSIGTNVAFMVGIWIYLRKQNSKWSVHISDSETMGNATAEIVRYVTRIGLQTPSTKPLSVELSPQWT